MTWATWTGRRPRFHSTPAPSMSVPDCLCCTCSSVCVETFPKETSQEVTNLEMKHSWSFNDKPQTGNWFSFRGLT